jgi:hypothetical protein
MGMGESVSARRAPQQRALGAIQRGAGGSGQLGVEQHS